MAAVHAHIRAAVEAGTPLPYDLRLEGETFVVDETTLSSAMVPPPALAVRSAPDNAGSPAGVLSTVQLAALGDALKEASPAGGLMPLPAAADVLLRRAAAKLPNGEPGLPTGWLDAGFTATASALRLFDPHATGYIEWRQLLSALVAASFPSIPSAGVAHLASAAASLAAADGDADGLLTRDELLGAKLWFDTDGMDMAAREAASKPGGSGHPRADALKGLLWAAFEGQGAGGGAGLVPWRPMLLHLCMDHDLLAALRKGFAAMDTSLDPVAPAEPALRGKAVATLAYPLGPGAGTPLGRAPLGPTEVAELVGRVAASRGSGKAVTAEQLMYSLPGGKLVAELLSWLQLQDPFSALRL